MFPDYIDNLSLKSITTTYDPDLYFGICLRTRIPDYLKSLGFVQHIINIDGLTGDQYYIHAVKELIPIVPADKRCAVLLPHLRSLVMPAIFAIQSITHYEPIIVREYRIKGDYRGYEFIDKRKLSKITKQLAKSYAQLTY